MSEQHVYKKTEIVGTGATMDEAIAAAIARASKTIRNLRWFEVEEVRGTIDRNQVSAFQVTLKVGFTLE